MLNFKKSEPKLTVLFGKAKMTSEKESVKMTDEDYKKIEQGKAEDLPKFIFGFLLLVFTVYLFFS